MEKFDIIIVGAGLFGSIIAKAATDKYKKVLVVDKRDHIGGNCYTQLINGINCHTYGPHVFHTNDREVWEYLNLFCELNNFTYRPKAKYGENLYSLPINLSTLKELWGIQTPQEAERKLKEVRLEISNPQNLEEYALSQLGEELYQTFIYGYTKKQWAKDPKDLPVEIIKRIPLKLTYDDNYFSDRWQGVPVGGYTEIFHKLLDRSAIEFNCDFIENRSTLEKMSNLIIYTGKIDEYYGYVYGDLEYRSLRFENVEHQGDFQGVAAVNYTNLEIPYTRIIEHQHFEFKNQEKSIITYEYPCEGKDAYYPINDKKNNSLFERYKGIPSRQVIFAGRLGSYRYLDMDETIKSALDLTKLLF